MKKLYFRKLANVFSKKLFKIKVQTVSKTNKTWKIA